VTRLFGVGGKKRGVKKHFEEACSLRSFYLFEACLSFVPPILKNSRGIFERFS